jgi:hypothetical protein
MANDNAVEFGGFLGLIVEEIGRGKGADRLRSELVALCGDKAGQWFDTEFGGTRKPQYEVFVRDWTGRSRASA